MQLPALLFKSLDYIKEVETEDELFTLLKQKPVDLVKFLVKACDDETWADNHANFMRQALSWITDEFFQDRLLMAYVRRLALVIREHYSAMLPYLPLNLMIKLKDRDIQINSLLFGSSSEFLRVMVRRECRDRKRTVLVLKDISYNYFDVIETFINTGSTLDLVRKDKPLVLKILKLAMQWELEELSIACQDYLKKYITAENVFTTMIKAHERMRLHLRAACYAFLNNAQRGYRFDDRGPESMGFEFLDFTEDSLEVFEKVRSYVTHLICGGKLTEDPMFIKVVNECPKLICLDISHSKTFADQLQEIPPDLQELEVADCAWMSNANLGRLLDICPELTSLSLVSDVDIGIEGWGALQKLDDLHRLNLTRCTQLTDDDLRVILQACKNLNVLQLEECRQLTDLGFGDIPKYIPAAVTLNLSRTWISTLPLIEIATNCRQLNKIDLTHCEHINGSALTELLRNGHELREVIVSHCDIPKSVIADLRKRFQFVKIIV